jgi:hypothetical protein
MERERGPLATALRYNFGELYTDELRRTPLPRIPVNKGKKKGRSCYCAPALFSPINRKQGTADLQADGALRTRWMPGLLTAR